MAEINVIPVVKRQPASHCQIGQSIKFYQNKQNSTTVCVPVPNDAEVGSQSPNKDPLCPKGCEMKLCTVNPYKDKEYKCECCGEPKTGHAFCDECKKSFKDGEYEKGFLRCKECDFDVCRDCRTPPSEPKGKFKLLSRSIEIWLLVSFLQLAINLRTLTDIIMVTNLNFNFVWHRRREGRKEVFIGRGG